MRHLHLVHSLSPSQADDGDDCPIDPVVQKLLEHVRTITPLPRFVRARALARARAAIADPRSTRLKARAAAPRRIDSSDRASRPRRA
jgi:hypothetical protein